MLWLLLSSLVASPSAGPFISHYSDISRAVHLQEYWKVDAEHGHMPVWAFHSICCCWVAVLLLSLLLLLLLFSLFFVVSLFYTFGSKAIESGGGVFFEYPLNG